MLSSPTFTENERERINRYNLNKLNYVTRNSRNTKWNNSIAWQKRDKHMQSLLIVSRMWCFLFRPRKRYFAGGESRSTRNYIWRLCRTRWKSCYPIYALFLVSTFIFLTIQFPSRRRSRKLFCLRRLGAESIFHVISAIVGNFGFQYTPSYIQNKINISF